MEKIIVYTDGSSLGNGRYDAGCGWACKLIYKGQELIKSGGDVGKTNNQMEMTAVLQAMRSITCKSIPVELYSDSSYVVDILNGKCQAKKNQELWKKIFEEKKRFRNISFIWIKGHGNDQHNIDVDKIATEESWKALYETALR